MILAFYYNEYISSVFDIAICFDFNVSKNSIFGSLRQFLINAHDICLNGQTYVHSYLLSKSIFVFLRIDRMILTACQLV